MRTTIQQLSNTQFIFSGSDQKMMYEIFNNAKRPFYASTKNLNLQRIDKKLYAAFITKHFINNNFKINDASINLILNFTDCHTYYTQVLCHDLFAINNKTINEELVLSTIKKIFTENEGVYYQYRSLLTAIQWKLLIALAKQEKVFMPYSKDFINLYKLGTPASVKRSLESLLSKNLVYYNNTIEKPYYEVQDKFLKLWIRDKY